MSEPVYDRQKGWTCPEGYAHPKCYGCGHNYFEAKPAPIVDGKALDYGRCHWCQQEDNE